MSEDKQQSGRARNWCITINSPEPDQYDHEEKRWIVSDDWALCPVRYDRFFRGLNQHFYWDELHRLGTDIYSGARDSPLRYLVFQAEICPTTHHLHIQAYCEFNAPIRLNNLKKIFNNTTIHAEPRRGTKEQAAAYCKKPDTRCPGTTPCAYGQQVLDGERTDLAVFYQDVKEGKDDYELFEHHTATMVRYPKAASHMRTAVATHHAGDRPRLQVHVLFGPPGCGKTHSAIQWARDMGGGYFLLTAASVASSGKTLWFDGYTNQKTLIIDDLNTDWIQQDTLLSLLERHRCNIQTKGGQTVAAWTHVYITTNYLPDSWFDSKVSGGTHGYTNKNALKRRITQIIDMTDNEVPDAPNFEPPVVSIAQVLNGQGSQEDPVIVDQ